MKHRSRISLFLVLIGCIVFQSCTKTAIAVLPGTWNELANFNGIARSGAVSFVIGNYAYTGTGFNHNNNTFLADFWKFDPVLNSWTQLATFPGQPRSNAAAFTLNGKGYVGTGLGGADSNNPMPLGDFWEFDPSTGPKGSWTQIKDFGYPTYDTALARYGALAFSVGGRGFVGGGYNAAGLKDLWEYDQINNLWILRPAIGGSKRQNAFVFVIDNYAYVGGGNDNGTEVTNFFRLDPAQLSSSMPWTELKSLTGNSTTPKARELASAFSINGFGYLACGTDGTSLGDMWQYTPPVIDNNGNITSGDTWIQYSPLAEATPAGSSRNSGVGFSIGSFGYLTTGKNETNTFNDCWMFSPAKN